MDQANCVIFLILGQVFHNVARQTSEGERNDAVQCKNPHCGSYVIEKIKPDMPSSHAWYLSIITFGLLAPIVIPWHFIEKKRIRDDPYYQHGY